MAQFEIPWDAIIPAGQDYLTAAYLLQLACDEMRTSGLATQLDRVLFSRHPCLRYGRRDVAVVLRGAWA